jgi:hypothetical protein
VYIGNTWFGRNVFGSRLSNLISSLNVEVKECRGCLVRDQHDASQFDQVLNSISPSGLDLKSGRKPFLDFITDNYLFVHGLLGYDL